MTWLTTLIAAVVLVILATLGMSIGLIFRNRPLKHRCGSLPKKGSPNKRDENDSCDKKDGPCDMCGKQ